MLVPQSTFSVRGALARYCDVLAALRPDNLETLTQVCTPDVRFRDPFNDVRGIDAYLAILASMYRRLGPVQFTIHDQTAGQQNSYLWWTMTWGPAGTPPIEGTSRLMFDSAGRVAEHCDYWDAARQLYERVPILGGVLRAIRQRLSG